MKLYEQLSFSDKSHRGDKYIELLIVLCFYLKFDVECFWFTRLVEEHYTCHKIISCNFKDRPIV